MRPEGSKAIGGAGSPGVEGANAAGSVIAAESALCEVLVGEGACWAKAVAAAGAFAEPMPPSEGMAITKAKAHISGRYIASRPGRRSTVATVADARATNLPEGTERSSILIRDPRPRNLENSKRRQGAHLKPCCRGGAPVHPSQHRGSVRNECEARRPRMKKIPPPSTGGRLLDALRSCSVAGSGKRDRNSTFPLALALPLRCLRV